MSLYILVQKYVVVYDSTTKKGQVTEKKQKKMGRKVNTVSLELQRNYTHMYDTDLGREKDIVTQQYQFQNGK